jgi:hypothetical protein
MYMFIVMYWIYHLFPTLRLFIVISLDCMPPTVSPAFIIYHFIFKPKIKVNNDTL